MYTIFAIVLSGLLLEEGQRLFGSPWLIIKYMFMIFHKKVYNYKSLFDELRKEVLFLISEKFIWKLEYDLYLLEDILLRTINGK